MTIRTGDATEHAPVKMWRESGPEWGNKVCAVHQFGPGVDATPSFQGLPDGLCPAPHWGYCLKGELTVRFKDGTEGCSAQLFVFMPDKPGLLLQHVPGGMIGIVIAVRSRK